MGEEEVEERGREVTRTVREGEVMAPEMEASSWARGVEGATLTT